MNDKKKRSIDVTEITYGDCPPELTITFNETIETIDLNKIVIGDVEVPNVITGLKIVAVEAA